MYSQQKEHRVQNENAYHYNSLHTGGMNKWHNINYETPQHTSDSLYSQTATLHNTFSYR